MKRVSLLRFFVLFFSGVAMGLLGFFSILRSAPISDKIALLEGDQPIAIPDADKAAICTPEAMAKSPILFVSCGGFTD